MVLLHSVQSSRDADAQAALLRHRPDAAQQAGTGISLPGVSGQHFYPAHANLALQTITAVSAKLPQK